MMTVRTITSGLEILNSFLLLEGRYRKEGYLLTPKSLTDFAKEVLRFLAYAWKIITSKVTSFVAVENGNVVGTIAVTIDKGRLAIEPVFGKELRDLRQNKKNIAYVGSFAASEQVSRTMTSIRLMSKVKEVCLENEADCICAVHPKHVGLYRRFDFEEVARKECMSGLHNAPIVLLYIPLERIKRNRL
jgi:predicted N-acetyltransferase YhbS